MIDHNALIEASRSLILSASGWRKVFALSGDEEDTTAQTGRADMALTAVMAAAFHSFLLSKGIGPGEGSRIAIASDSRPTGPSIIGQFVRYFTSAGYGTAHLGVAAAPEIMAFAGEDEEISAFIYVSASHNPVGHNGVKFGLSDGGVLGGEDAHTLISTFKNILGLPAQCAEAIATAAACDEKAFEAVLGKSVDYKQAALRIYQDFLVRTVTGATGPAEAERIISLLRDSAALRGFGVLGELNGSARAASVDAGVFEYAGFNTHFAGAVVGEISHRIVPEGESLDPARIILEELHSRHPGFCIGYVPDNDGDRGNLVYILKDGTSRALEAQEVFALAVLSELAYQRWLEEFRGDTEHTAPLAVAVNGPTSMRIDRIAEAFSAGVFRAEVGEANAVNLARALRKQAYRVPILGEGSNGGNITHPSSVRDPLCTVFAIAKLLLIRDTPERMGLFHRWLEASGRGGEYHDDFTLPDIIESLPLFTTTSAYESRAVLRLGSFDHGLLKKEWEKIFAEQWEERKETLLEKYGIAGWEEQQYEGTEQKNGTGAAYRSGAETGGLKVLFLDGDGKATDCIWMRGSGTEPVFRILADCQGTDAERERYFLDWHRSMIEAAYRRIE
jgi:phosphoglucomutase